MGVFFLAALVFAAFARWCFRLWQNIETVNAEIEDAIAENRRLWMDAPYSIP